MSRLVAIADAHLGRAHYQAVDPSGLNQREVDFAAAWHRAVEAALGLDPDAVLVLGDLFDAPGPPTGRSGRGPGGCGPWPGRGADRGHLRQPRHPAAARVRLALCRAGRRLPRPAVRLPGRLRAGRPARRAAGPRRAPVHRRPRPQGPDRSCGRRPLRRPPEPARHPRRRDRPGPPLHLRRRQRARGRPVHPGRRVRPHPARPLPQLRQGRPQRLVSRLHRHLQLQGPAPGRRAGGQGVLSLDTATGAVRHHPVPGAGPCAATAWTPST